MDYEQRIQKRREENFEKLKCLGILSASYGSTSSKSPAIELSKRSSKPKATNKVLAARSMTPTRRSGRLLGKELPKYNDDLNQLESNDNFAPVESVKIKQIKKENTFGAIPGVPVGTVFLTRLEASVAGIHRPPVAGIHGNSSAGCYSLALSGGYEDDIDEGHSFIYTGEGGRDLKGTKANPKNLRTAPQSKDQILERGNLALSKNIENNVPVRVLRGYKLRSKFAPIKGYRYDGLYNVVRFYNTKGLSGFNVLKFCLERMENQEPAPWLYDFNGSATDSPREGTLYPQMKLEDNSRTPYMPQVKILKLPNDAKSTGVIVGKSPSQQPVKTLKQREAEYAEARLRILGSASSEEDQSPRDQAVSSTTKESDEE